MAPVECSEIVRPNANFSPSLWGDLFSSSCIDNQLSETCGEEIEVLKKQTRSMICADEDKFEEKLILIDTIERLGFAYHFEEEIERQLNIISNGYSKLEIYNDNYKLFTSALHFRLLRQHGHDVSPHIFDKFLEDNGKWKQALKSDIKGLLSLYEAAHARTHGEDILDEALAFATTHLKSSSTLLMEPSLKKQVLNALEQSIHRGIQRIEACKFISFYQEDESKNEVLLRLAKLDFNLVQMLHKEELYQLSRWWKELDLVGKLSYPRDRLVESYLWGLGAYAEPQYSSGRIMIAKNTIMTSVVDDTYDAYGTIEELKVFTEAVERWDISEIDHLPDYMKIIYKFLLDVVQSYDDELAPQGRSYTVHDAKESIKELIRSYYIEAKWFIGGYKPPFAEYMSNAKITCTYYIMTIIAIMGMDCATKEAFEWIVRKPKILEATVTLCRVIDDIASYDDETSRGQKATGIDCYMKEYGLSRERAFEAFHEIAEKSWKDVNGSLNEICYPKNIVTRVLNFARMIDITYKNDEDGYTHPEKVLKPHIIALFLQSFEL